VIEDLLRSLRSNKPADRWRAAQQLIDAVRSQEADALRALGDALEDEHPFVRWCVGLTLAEADRPLATATLLDALERGSPRQQAAAADALAYARQANAGPLLHALTSEETLVRQSAAEALGRLGYQPAMSHLTDLLSDDSPWVRRAAIRALGHIGDRRAADPLTQGLADDSAWVRRSAAYALGAIRAQQATSQLIAALDDPDPQVRRNAAWALGRIRDPNALPKLRALKDETALDREVAQEAEAAISAIQRPDWLRLPAPVQKWLQIP
jgi:HEAT repeat protein